MATHRRRGLASQPTCGAGWSSNRLAESAHEHDGYEGYIRREIVPAIGGLEIAKVRPGHIRAVLTRMQHRGLAAASIAQARGILGSALRQAVEDGLIASIPVASIKRPRIRRRALHWPTTAQLVALLHVSRETLWEIPILLAVVTGARRSEILGITWEDVDLGLGTVFIRRGVQPNSMSRSRRSVAFTPLKTRRGISGRSSPSVRPGPGPLPPTRAAQASLRTWQAMARPCR